MNSQDFHSEYTFQYVVGKRWRWGKTLYCLKGQKSNTFPINLLCLKPFQVQMHSFLLVCMKWNCRDLKAVCFRAIILQVSAAFHKHHPAVNAEGIDHSAQCITMVHHSVLSKEDTLSRSTPVNPGHSLNGTINGFASITNASTQMLNELMRLVTSSCTHHGGGNDS